jgi:Tol biopolymer transport system component
VTSALAAVVLSSLSFAQVPTLVDIVAGGGPPADGAREGSISPDGRWVAFTSPASDLVPNDTNGDTDVFLRDRATSTIVRVSVSTGGGESHPAPAATTFPTTFVSSPAVSNGGRFVVFASSAPDLVANDTNGFVDVFVHDVLLNTTERVSVGAGGVQGNNESGIAYVQSSGFGGPFTYSVPTGVAISPDGRYVAFGSIATNLVAATLAAQSIFLRDRNTGVTELISVSGGGTGVGPSWFPSMSADGRYVAFESFAGNLVPNDTNLKTDVFVRDRTAGSTVRASEATGGLEANGDSGFLLFDPPFCPDCGIQAIELGSQISADGHVVVFGSQATNLATVGMGTPFEPPRNVFRHDLQTGVTTLVSATSLGVGGNAASINPSVSADGRYTAYESAADDIVTVPPQSGTRVLVQDFSTGLTSVASLDATGSIPAFDSAGSPTISDDGGRIAFVDFSDLHTADTNQNPDVYASGPAIITFSDACEGTLTTCPCGNVGAPGAGCANSAQPNGSRLEATGVPSVSQDSVVLVATRLVPNTVVLFAQSSVVAPTASAPVFGDGVRCLLGTIRRLRTVNATGDTALLGQSAPHISTLGQVPVAGGTRFYAAIYRNAAPFCGPSTFNSSNAIRIDWTP